ncbi:MAG TPA: DUF1365 domain-containing protein, partial [Pseudobdellovibrionaceae bacterium]|nr:DUF1365 domain-containing protein [Pseudobdellovibrionaceae bacterium]
FGPRVHQFHSRVFFIRFPLDNMNDLKRGLFSVNRWNLLSFYEKDHGSRDGSSLKSWVLARLKEKNFHEAIDSIELQTFPRVLGYVFNPVSFWYCYSQGELRAVLAEVNSTFGETYSYVIDPKNPEAKKQLQVSPFLQVQGGYHFSFDESSPNKSVTITYSEESLSIGPPKLVARISGQAMPWTTINLLKMFIFRPMMTFMVIGGIHFHALILFLKRTPFYGKNGHVREV